MPCITEQIIEASDMTYSVTLSYSGLCLAFTQIALSSSLALDTVTQTRLDRSQIVFYIYVCAFCDFGIYVFTHFSCLADVPTDSSAWGVSCFVFQDLHSLGRMSEECGIIAVLCPGEDLWNLLS